MADHITSVSTIAALRSWWDSTVPASDASGDNWIAECAAGIYDLNAVSGTWSGKSISGQIIIRPQSSALLSSAARALRASSSDGVYFQVPNTNVNFLSANTVIDGIQVASGGAPSSSLQLTVGCKIVRCIVSDCKITFDNNGGSIIDSALLRSQSDVCAWLPNSCTVTGCTFVHFAGGTSVATGSAITAKNNAFVSIGGSTAFSGSMDGSSTNNAFNVGTTYGSAAVTITASAQFVSVASNASADLRLQSGASLATAGASGVGSGTDVYYQPRTISYSIGAYELDAGGGGSTQSVTIATSAQGNHAAAAAITQSSSGTLTSAKLENNVGTLFANISGWTAEIRNPTTGALVVRITGLTTSAGGILTMTHALIVPGTAYACEYIHATYGRILPVLTAA